MDWEVIKQTIEFFILKTIGSQEAMGTAVEQLVEEKIGPILKLKPAAVSSALIALERMQLLASNWRNTGEQGIQKFYSLTAAGQYRLAAESDERQAQLSSFMSGEGFDGSFKKFLDRHVNVYCIWPPPHQ